MSNKTTIPNTECIVWECDFNKEKDSIAAKINSYVFYPTNEISGIPIEEVKKNFHFWKICFLKITHQLKLKIDTVLTINLKALHLRPLLLSAKVFRATIKLKIPSIFMVNILNI